MSVIKFSEKDLGEIAGCAVGGSLASTTGQRQLRQFAESLADISRGNIDAYNQTYGEMHSSIDADQIEEWARRNVTRMNCKRAVQNAQSLNYNTSPTPKSDAGLAHVLTAMLRSCTRD